MMKDLTCTCGQMVSVVITDKLVKMLDSLERGRHATRSLKGVLGFVDVRKVAEAKAVAPEEEEFCLEASSKEDGPPNTRGL